MSDTYNCEGCNRDTEIRKMPVTPGNPDHGNMLLCHRCFVKEINARFEFNCTRPSCDSVAIPIWANLEIIP